MADSGAAPPPKPVWHCSLRNHADDPVLSDQQWARIAAQFMAGVGLAPHDDLRAVRWSGIRHGDDGRIVQGGLADRGRRPALQTLSDVWATRFEWCQPARRFPSYKGPTVEWWEPPIA